jgi:hypothetical protein
MTPDLLRLREKQSELASVLDRLELELVDDPSWTEPSDTSYLSLEDRANPDIMSNVAAMAATNRLVSWFGKDIEGFVGLWRGEDGRPLAQAPVVRLDTEGQYAIVAATIPDYLVISVPDDEFAQTRDALARVGFQVSMNADAVWGALDGFDDPNAYRNALYAREREQRGVTSSGVVEEEVDDDPEEMAALGAEKRASGLGSRASARKEKPTPKVKAKLKAGKAKPKAKAKPAKVKGKSSKAKPSGKSPKPKAQSPKKKKRR